MNEKTKGKRIEYFSDADVIAHGREARRKGQPIWTNPFMKERAGLWRKAWYGSHEPVGQAERMKRYWAKRKKAERLDAESRDGRHR